MIFTLLATASAGFTQPVRITFAYWPDTGEAEVVEEWVAAFNRQNPDIHVEILVRSGFAEQAERVQVEFAANVAPDVVMAAEPNAWIKAGILMPLDDFIAREPEVISALNPSTLKEWQLELRDDGVLALGRGHYYALPFNDFAVIVAYNRQLFREAGLDEPDDEAWTYDEFTEIGRRLVKDTDGDGNNEVWGLNWHHQSPNTTGALALAYGSNYPPIVLEPRVDTDVDSPEFRAALEVQRRWMFEDRIVPPYGVSIPSFGLNSHGMTVVHNASILDFIHGYPELDFDLARMPSGPAGKYARVFTQAIGITSSTPHPEAAWRFVKYLVSEAVALDMAERLVSMPSHREGVIAFMDQLPLERKRVFPDTFLHDGYIYLEPIPYQRSILDMLRNPGLNPVWEGTQTVEAATEEVARLIRSALSEALR